MNRRIVLQTLGGGFLLASGCLTTAAPDNSTVEQPIEKTDTHDTMTNTSEIDRLQDRGLQTIDSEQDDHPVILRTETGVLSLENGVIQFVLENRGEETFGWNPCDWGLFKWTGTTWEKVAPELVAEPYSELSGGDEHHYQLVVGDTTVERGDFCGTKTLSDLSVGTYSFCVYGSYSEESQKTYAAQFTVVE